MAKNKEIINATTDEARGNWTPLGIVIGVSSETRESALANMNEKAARMGANAVVGIRFDSVMTAVHMPMSDTFYGTEYAAYGTALRNA